MADSNDKLQNINQQQVTQQTAPEDDDLDIMGILRRLWEKRVLILVIAGIFALFGAISALSEKPKYTASCTFVPQFSSPVEALPLYSASSLSSRSSLESILAGRTMSPLVYSQLFENVDFNKELMRIPLHFNKYSEPISIYDLKTDPKYRDGVFWANVKKYTIHLPGTIIGKLKKKEPAIEKPSDSKQEISMYTPAEYGVAQALSSMVVLDVDKKDIYFRLSATTQDPLASAELCQAALELMQKYITDFKLKRANVNLEYTRERYEEAKADYEAKQLALAKFTDSNRGALTATAQIQEEHLSSDYQLAYALFSEMSKRLLQLEMSVKEDTPIFSTIEPVSIPLYKNNNRMLTFVTWLAIGLILGCGLVVGLDWLKKEKPEWLQKWN